MDLKLATPASPVQFHVSAYCLPTLQTELHWLISDSALPTHNDVGLFP